MQFFSCNSLVTVLMKFDGRRGRPVRIYNRRNLDNGTNGWVLDRPTLKTRKLSSVRVVNEIERKSRERRAPKARELRQRRRRGGLVWGGGIPLPSGEGSGKGAVQPPQKFFCLAMVHFVFGAFWALVLMLV